MCLFVSDPVGNGCSSSKTWGPTPVDDLVAVSTGLFPASDLRLQIKAINMIIPVVTVDFDSSLITVQQRFFAMQQCGCVPHVTHFSIST